MTNAQHITYGLHSNIPLCCINFFLTKWSKRLASGINAHNRDPKANYIRCDDCLANSRLSEIHFCHIGCNEFLSEHKLGKFREDTQTTTSSYEFCIDYGV